MSTGNKPKKSPLMRIFVLFLVALMALGAVILPFLT